MHRLIRGVFAACAVVVLTLAASGGVATAGRASQPAVPAVASIAPGPGETVGVAYPVIVHFAAPVTDRAAAEQTIHITPASPTAGHFEWLDTSVVQWVPDGYWPAHTRVVVETQSMSSGFQTGDEVLAVADISEHTFTVSINEVVQRVMPASMGKPTRPTPIGSFTALSKERKVKFDSRTIGIPLSDPEGYLIDGEYGVRVTWSGVYVHSAPWSVNSQGYANVSHGCINLGPDNAAWYFGVVNIGDPIIVQA